MRAASPRPSGSPILRNFHRNLGPGWPVLFAAPCRKTYDRWNMVPGVNTSGWEWFLTPFSLPCFTVPFVSAVNRAPRQLLSSFLTPASVIWVLWLRFTVAS